MPPLKDAAHMKKDPTCSRCMGCKCVLTPKGLSPGKIVHFLPSLC
jgi:hypothetical protein